MVLPEASIKVPMAPRRGHRSRTVCRRTRPSMRWLRPRRQFMRQSAVQVLSKLPTAEITGPASMLVYGAFLFVHLSAILLINRFFMLEQALCLYRTLLLL